MQRVRKRHWLTVVGMTGLALGSACSGDDDGSGSASESGSTGSAETGTPTGSSSMDQTGAGTDSVGDGSTSNGTDASDTGGSDGGSTGTTGGMVEPSVVMHVVPSSRVVLEADDGGQTAVRCYVLDEGLPYDGDYTADVSVTPMAGVSDNGGVYTFDEFGVWEASCSTEIMGDVLDDTVGIAVLNEAIDPRLARAGAGLGSLQTGLIEIMASDGEDDQVLVDAATYLTDAIDTLDDTAFAELDDVLRTLPPGGYPSTAELDGQGITANADDDALAGQLDALGVALATVRSTYEGLDPATLTRDDVMAVQANEAMLEATLDDVLALQPTAHGYLATRTQLADLIRDELVPTVRAIAVYNDAMMREQADSVFGIYFGFIGLSMGMFNSSNLQVQLIQDWYGPYIEELDKSFNNLIALDLIDYFFPPDPQGPVIEYFVGSASQSFVTPGYDSYLDGYGFHETAEWNMFIVVGDGWQQVAENIWTACGVEESDTLPEAIEKIESCVEDVADAVEESLITPLSVSEPGLFGSEQYVDFGPFPPACDGALPQAIGIIPINLAVGRGPAITRNCTN